jgi:hypothetical protein
VARSVQIKTQVKELEKIKKKQKAQDKKDKQAYSKMFPPAPAPAPKASPVSAAEAPAHAYAVEPPNADQLWHHISKFQGVREGGN